MPLTKYLVSMIYILLNTSTLPVAYNNPADAGLFTYMQQF